MTEVDWIIIAFTVLLALYGWAQGFVVGVLTLAGFAAGGFAGTRLGPHLLTDGSASPYAPLFGLLGAVTAGAILAMGFEGVGIALRRQMRAPGLGAIDGLLGAALTACVALGLAWILGAVALQTPGAIDLRKKIQRSAILQRLNSALPPSGPILQALARVDPSPRVDGPGARVGPPNAAIARDPDVRAAGDSVVRVLGSACGLGVEGSGWVAAPGLVVTNAHVVAGEEDTTVSVNGKDPRLDASAVLFDPRNDIAVLRVSGLPGRARPLAIAQGARPGTAGAVLGYPENGPYHVAAARLGDTRTALTQDAYGQGPVSRLVTSLRGEVRSGNSGGPMVDGAGRVLTTVFAATVASRTKGGFGVPDSVVRAAIAQARRGGPTGTGPCTR